MLFLAPVAAAIALTMSPLVTSQQTKPAPASTTPAKPRPAEIRFVLHLVRQSEAPAVPATSTVPAVTPPATLPLTPILIATPILVTVDGQTASMDVKSTDTTFFVSLSPTLELADNTGKAENETKKSTVRLDWNLRLGGKALPGGVTSLAITGATRLILSDTADAVIARLSLADPKTGQITEYRLEGQAQLPNKPETTVVPVVTPVPANP